MATIELCGVSKRFGDVDAIQDFSATVESGTTLAIMGPSGAGKSTLLRTVAGLQSPDSGIVKIDGVDALRLSPSQRSVAMVTQDYALYPQQSVERNLQAAVKSLKLPRAEVRQRIDTALRLLGIESLAKRRPNQLSGGQLQRAALGRAIVRRPSVLLLDEPLSQLDVPLKVELRQLLCSLSAELSMTTLAVLHDPLDAMVMADTVFLMDGGRLIQSGAPESVYGQPESLTAARLFSPLGVNWIAVDGLDGKLDIPAGFCAVGFRPEAAKLCANQVPSPSGLHLRVSVRSLRYIGGARLAECDWRAAGKNCVMYATVDVSAVASEPVEECWLVVPKRDLLLRTGDSVTAFQALAEPPASA